MQEEIVALCNQAFAKYFAEVPSTQHAIADRGWNPLNQTLLFNTQVSKTKIVEIVDKNTVTTTPRNIFTGDKSVISPMTSTSSVSSTSSATRSRVAQMLNLKCGLAGTIITDLLQYAMKEEGVNKNLKKRFAEGKMFREEIVVGKRRVTAGLLFKASQLGLGSNVLNFQERKEIIVFGTRELAWLKAVGEYTMWKAAALDILALNNPFAALGMKELKAHVHYKKIKDHGAVPGTEKDILESYKAIC